MACGTYTLSGQVVGCLDNAGGIKKVEIAERPDSGLTFTTSVDGSVSGITGASTWYSYTFRKQTGSMDSTAAFSDAAGTLMFTTNVNLVFAKMEKIKTFRYYGFNDK